jgi:hypothetical protein
VIEIHWDLVMGHIGDATVVGLVLAIGMQLST